MGMPETGVRSPILRKVSFDVNCASVAAVTATAVTAVAAAASAAATAAAAVSRGILPN